MKTAQKASESLTAIERLANTGIAQKLHKTNEKVANNLWREKYGKHTKTGENRTFQAEMTKKANAGNV